MTPEEAKKMEGTEFDFVYEDGDSIRAFVKKFDPEIGLTCMTLSTKSNRDGYYPDNREEDGTWCVIGSDFRYHSLSNAFAKLDMIQKTGKYVSGAIGCNSGSGVTCAFR